MSKKIDYVLQFVSQWLYKFLKIIKIWYLSVGIGNLSWATFLDCAYEDCHANNLHKPRSTLTFCSGIYLSSFYFLLLLCQFATDIVHWHFIRVLILSNYLFDFREISFQLLVFGSSDEHYLVDLLLHLVLEYSVMLHLVLEYSVKHL